MASTTTDLATRIEEQLDGVVDPAVARFAQALATEAGAAAVLFYGSNLRTGSLEGVLDFYILLPGEQRDKIWPRVSYQEREEADGTVLRAKIATMALSTFGKAASGVRRGHDKGRGRGTIPIRSISHKSKDNWYRSRSRARTHA